VAADPKALTATAAKYAPLVVLHDEEKLWPCAPEWFMSRSSLRWATGTGRDGAPVAGAEDAIDAARLGAASTNPYAVGGFLASQLTRPLDDNSARGTSPPAAQGFFLRLREEKFARGDKATSPDGSTYAGVPCYWDYDETAKALTYWFFYAGSAPPLGLLRLTEQIGLKARDAGGVPPDEAPPAELEAATAAAYLAEFQEAYPGLAAEVTPPAPPVGAKGFPDFVRTIGTVAEGINALLRDDNVLHEGDWERMTLYLDKSDPFGAAPEAAAFYRHSTNTFRKWDGVEKAEGTHPVGYAAIGSHATLPTPGFGHIDVGDPDGPRWQTWQGLRSIIEEPWYGFGGAWGRLGKVRDATGPLGPGAHWKHAAPRPPS
jgi:hypothetical protein